MKIKTVKKDGRKVFLLLDLSSSMIDKWKETVDSINEYVSGIEDKTSEILFATFNTHEFNILHNGKLNSWEPIHKDTVIPSGGTPLLDSMSIIFTQAEIENNERTLIVVMTDGYENSSVKTTKQNISDRIKNLEIDNKPVIFLGADFSGVTDSGSLLGTTSSRTLNIPKGNMKLAMRDLSARTSSFYSSDVNSQEYASTIVWTPEQIKKTSE